MPKYPRGGPLVSVIIPAHNAERYLSESIESVLAQTYQDLELVVVNDGSTDGTQAVLEQYNAHIAHLLRQPQLGVSAARNAGLRTARGELVAFLDADDRWHPRKLERQVQCLRLNPEAGATTTGVRLIGPAGCRIGLSRVENSVGIVTLGLREVVELFSFVTSSLLVRRDVLEWAGVFDESLETAEELDLIARVSARYPIMEIREALLEYRLSDDSLSKRLFTGNRLRVLEKIAQTPIAESPELRHALRRTRAKVHLSYADDLLWHGHPHQARTQLLGSLRQRPSLRAVTLLAKAMFPVLIHQRLRRHGPAEPKLVRRSTHAPQSTDVSVEQREAA